VGILPSKKLVLGLRLAKNRSSGNFPFFNRWIVGALWFGYDARQYRL